MIKFIKKHNIVILLLSVFILFLSFYLIREFIASRNTYTESYMNGKEYVMNPKKYGVNEYSPTNITDEQMANIYLNDFKHNLYSDINYAYELLNSGYRQLKFGSIENFINYVNGLNYSNMIVDRYSVDGDLITVYTKDDMEYIFKIISVMEYEVYLDDYTVEI